MTYVPLASVPMTLTGRALASDVAGEVSLLLDDGSTKDDLNLPDFVKHGEPTDEDKKTSAELDTFRFV